MRLTTWCGIILVASLTALSNARADRWQRAQTREVFDATRNWFVRVIPGESWGDVFGFHGAAVGRYAAAESYQRQEDGSYRSVATFTLLNPIAPVEYLVSTSGEVIAIDNWHNRGYGAAVAIYSANGALVRSYALADLFSQTEIEAFTWSASSIQWHEGPIYLQVDQQAALVTVGGGATFLFGLTTGSFKYCEINGETYRCRSANADRTWLSNADVPDPS